MNCAVTEGIVTDGIAKRHIMLIGYGNTLRSDDGAGVALARQLADHWRGQEIPVTLIICAQLMPELAAEIAERQPDAVLFVDAAVSPLFDAIRVQRLEMQVKSPVMGHQLDPSALLAYAGLLYNLVVPAWLITVPGVNFAHGERFNAHMARLVDEAPALSRRLLAEIDMRR